MKVHVLKVYDLDFQQQITSNCKNIQIEFGALPQNCDEIEVLITGRPSKEEIERCKNLKYLLIPFSGIPETTKERMKNYPHIAVHNLHHNALSVAENAITFLFSMAKDIIPAHNDLKQGNWTIRYSQNPSSFITGKNILLLGFGSIGQTIYDLLSGFRMQFYVFNRTKKLSKFAHLVRSKDELLDILPNIDFIINSLPLTKTTTNFLNQNELLQMKKSCCLVNVGRAATVHENSLYLALKQKRIKAAYFDVWYHYPSDQLTRKFTRPTNAPFHELDNFYYSPHRAGGLGIHDLEKNRALDLIHFIHCWADGKPLPNQMDLELGY